MHYNISVKMLDQKPIYDRKLVKKKGRGAIINVWMYLYKEFKTFCTLLLTYTWKWNTKFDFMRVSHVKILKVQYTTYNLLVDIIDQKLEDDRKLVKKNWRGANINI